MPFFALTVQILLVLLLHRHNGLLHLCCVFVCLECLVEVFFLSMFLTHAVCSFTSCCQSVSASVLLPASLPTCVGCDVCLNPMGRFLWVMHVDMPVYVSLPASYRRRPCMYHRAQLEWSQVASSESQSQLLGDERVSVVDPN